MARSNPGGAATDRITYGESQTNYYPYSHPRTLSCWMYRTSNDTSDFWRIFGEGQSGGGTSNRWWVATRNVGGSNQFWLECYASPGTDAGNWAWAFPPLNTWVHLCITHDTTTIGTAPTIYHDGVAQSLTLVAAWDVDPLQTPTSRITILGGRSGGKGWFGSCGEFAMWTQILGIGEIKALSRGVSPLRIRPGKLNYYWPLFGQTVEADWTSNRVGEMTGTTAVRDAPCHPSGPMVVV